MTERFRSWEFLCIEKNGKQAKMKSGSMKYFVDVLQLSVHEVVATEKMLNQITALIVDINEQIFL